MKINNTQEEAQHPWPEGTGIQGGGRGLVFTKDGDSYRTAFVEVSPRGKGFIRGEGETIQAAENSAWKQFQRNENCPGHEWEARNYKNGAGFCKHCGKFGSKVFTPEELGCFCKVCGVPTYWDRRGDDFYCPEHPAPKEDHRSTGSVLGDLFRALEEDEEEAKS